MNNPLNINDKGNTMNYEYRNYDAQVGIFKSIDPLAEKYAGVSPYAAFGLNPIMYVDFDGDSISFSEAMENIDPANPNQQPKDIIVMTFIGDMINESSTPYTDVEMDKFAKRASNAIKEYYGISFDNPKVVVHVDIKPASANNPLVKSDHAIRIVDDGRIPTYPGSTLPFASRGTTGYTPYGENLIYLSNFYFADLPAQTGVFAGTGKSNNQYNGGATLERTFGHEVLHSANIKGHPTAGSKPGNLQNQTAQPDAGIQVEKEQILKMKQKFENGNLNKGMQRY